MFCDCTNWMDQVLEKTENHQNQQDGENVFVKSSDDREMWKGFSYINKSLIGQ